MSDEERARFEVLLEDIQGTVQFIAEGHTAIRGEIRDLRSDFGEMKGTLDLVRMDVSVLKKDVSVLKTDVAVLKTDMAAVKIRVGKIEHHIGLNGTVRPKKRPATVRRPKK